MSNKSNSNQQQPNEDEKQNIEELSDDLDFWNIDTNDNHINTDASTIEELEKILEENKTNQPLQSLSGKYPDMEIPCEKDIISSLDQLDKKLGSEKMLDSTNQNIENTNANVSSEGNEEVEENEIVTDSSIPKESNALARSPIEKVATLISYLGIISVFTYLIIYASKQHNFDTSKVYEPFTQVKGDYVDIENIETWWSKPVGNNTKFGVVLVPSLTITLSPDSKSGVIRSVFYSSEQGLLGQLRQKGDPFTYEFVDGRFLETNTNQITIHGTDGFTELAHYNFYRNQEEKRWTIEVREAPSLQTEVNGFKSVASAPIEPIRK